MKTVGLIGGIAPESTIEYYRGLVREYQAVVRDGSYPPVLINSIDLARLLRLAGAGELGSLADWLADEIGRLADAGADLVALASNTPHIVFDELRMRSPVPMLSIVDAACDAALALGSKRVGLFGTRFTMEAPFYPAAFASRGIALLLPEPRDREYIHEKYVGELVKGVFLPHTRQALLAIIASMHAAYGVEAVILGGTELPLLFRDAPSPAVPFLDTTAIHVKKIVREMLA